ARVGVGVDHRAALVRRRAHAALLAERHRAEEQLRDAQPRGAEPPVSHAHGSRLYRVSRQHVYTVCWYGGEPCPAHPAAGSPRGDRRASQPWERAPLPAAAAPAAALEAPAVPATPEVPEVPAAPAVPAAPGVPAAPAAPGVPRVPICARRSWPPPRTCSPPGS